MVVLWILVGLIIGSIVGIVLMRFIPKFGVKEIYEKKENLINEAKKEADEIVKSASLKAKEINFELKQKADEEIKEMKSGLVELENRLNNRESNIDRRDTALLQKEENFERKLKQIEDKTAQLNTRENEINQKRQTVILELQRVASLTLDEAKNELMKIVEEKTEHEMTVYIKTKEEEAKSKAVEHARKVLTETIERYSQEVAVERTVSVVSLPNDELKGRIIGREGRNIRTLEQLTGVDLIIDDTPEVITVSSFDPIRREIAKMSLEKLIKDGRIQPGRIEEVVEKTKEELNEIIAKTGEDAIFELGLSRVPQEVVEHLGRLKYRTSYGQNALKHSMEVAHLTGLMAEELGLDPYLAKRAGLFHDIGKAIDFEAEGTHVELGAKLLRKHKEHPVVINAVESHHGDHPVTDVISNLVAAADTLSAARPGARSETLENYIKRVEKLEEISKEFKGVSQAYAIQAGREIRIMVEPDVVDDVKSYKLARDIRDKIENELTYPGQIKVTVIRETRASEVAK